MENNEIVDLVISTTEGLSISNAQDLQNATNFIKDIREKREMIEHHYEPMVKAAKKAYDIAKEERDKYVKPLKQCEDNVKKIMNDYNTKLMQLEKINREQELKRLVETQVVESTIDSVENKEKINNMSTRKKVKIVVEDISKVPTRFRDVPLLELSKFGEQWLLNCYKKDNTLEIDGIKFVEEAVTVIR